MKLTSGRMGLLAALLLLAPGLAVAQVQITVHMTDGTADADLTDGTGHFIGEAALQDAVWGLQNNFDAAGALPTGTEADDATITIQDSGHYVGNMLVAVRNLTVTVAAGQTPTIEGGGPWAQTVIIGQNYDGTALPASINIIGDSNENRITLIGSQVTPHYGVHAINAQAEGMLLENINYVPGQEPGGCPENHHGHPVNVVADATGTYTMTNVQLTMSSTSTGAGSNMQNGPWMNAPAEYNYNNVEFISGGFWTHGIFNVDATANFTDCSIIGQGCNMNSGVVNHLRTTFLGNAHPIRDDVWAGTANIDITFDDCTFTSGSDVMVGMVHGGSATIKNSTIDGASATVLAARVRGGDVTFENCVIDGPGFDNAGGDITTPANLTLDGCTVLNGSEARFFAAGAGSTAESTVNVNNTIWNGTGGTAISSQPLMADGSVVQQTNLNVTHSTFLGAYGNVPIAYGEGVVNMSYSIVDGSNSAAQGTLEGDTAVAGQGNLLWIGSATDEGIVGSGSVPGDTIVAPPMLTSTGHLANGGSPALQQAIGSTETVDIDGDARPQPAGTENDIGADEANISPVLTVVATVPRTQQPALDSSAFLMIMALNGNGALTYEWFFDNGSGAVAIANSNAPALTIESVGETDAGGYYCVVTDDDGSVTGPLFTLDPPPQMPVSAWPLLMLLPVAALFVLRRRQVRSH